METHTEDRVLVNNKDEVRSHLQGSRTWPPLMGLYPAASLKVALTASLVKMGDHQTMKYIFPKDYVLGENFVAWAPVGLVENTPTSPLPIYREYSVATVGGKTVGILNTPEAALKAGIEGGELALYEAYALMLALAVGRTANPVNLEILFPGCYVPMGRPGDLVHAPAWWYMREGFPALVKLDRCGTENVPAPVTA